MDWNALGTWFGGFGAWFSGIATLSAVLIALRLQRLYEKRERPSLSVTFGRNSDCLRYIPPRFATPEDQEYEREELWIRIIVTNSGENAARDVEVRLVDVHINGESQPESRSSKWFKASNINLTSVKLLPRGFSHPFDIAFAVHTLPTDATSFHLVTTEPDLRPWAEEKLHIERDQRDGELELGRLYHVHFAALSSNADAIHYRLSMKLAPRREDDPPGFGAQGPDALKARLLLEPLQKI